MNKDNQSQKTKRALTIVAALLLSLLMFGAGFAGGYYAVDKRARSLAWMAKTVADNYVDGATEDELYDRMYDALELDRFCTHYTPAEYKTVVAASKGKGSGFGFSVSKLDETTRVYDVTFNSPAERAGLKGGMYILRFGSSEDTLQKGTREEALSYLSGVSSCVLECGYKEDGSDARLLSFSREDYLASYVAYADAEGSYRFRGDKSLSLQKVGEGLPLPKDTAYIRFTQFEGKAATEFSECLKKVKEQNKSELVLDMRSNGGGYLDILCRIASHLLKNAEGSRPVVATAPDVGRGETYRAYGNDYEDYLAGVHVRVLLDEHSASATEALVGAMLDYGTLSYEDISIRIGEDGSAHSFGKGVMQSHFTAPDGNVLRLTVSRILSPNGNSIHGVGFTAEQGARAVAAPLLPESDFDLAPYLS